MVGREKGTNVVIAGSSEAAEAAAVDRFTVAEPSWISGAPVLPKRVDIKLRHGPRLVGGMISVEGGTAGSARPGVGLEVKMDEPDRGVAAGQFAVFYDGDLCLGGGMIE